MGKHINYTKENLEAAAKASTSFMGVIRYFGLKECGGNHKAFQDRMKVHGIDTSHFTGSGWARGLTATTDTRVALQARGLEVKTDEQILTMGSRRVEARRLRVAMIRAGIPHRCSIPNCPVTGQWLGKPITIHIDHIDGNPCNNRLDNVRFLCPNCHQQTDTWGSKAQRLVDNSGLEPENT